MVAWKTWKLRRKAISTNDGEIQAVLKGEEMDFRTRFLWAQLNGCCSMDENDMLNQANKMIHFIPGVLGTDS